jgi:hypothetical protein
MLLLLLQDVSNTLWALAALQLQPSTELHEFLLSRAQLHAAQLKTQEVANILWALSQLKLAPSSSWLQDVLLRQVANKAQWLETPAQVCVCTRLGLVRMAWAVHCDHEPSRLANLCSDDVGQAGWVKWDLAPGWALLLARLFMPDC